MIERSIYMNALSSNAAGFSAARDRFTTVRDSRIRESSAIETIASIIVVISGAMRGEITLDHSSFATGEEVPRNIPVNVDVALTLL